MASTSLVYDVKAMHVVRSRTQHHLHAHERDSAQLTAHASWNCDEFIQDCNTVKMTSRPTAISDFFHEPVSIRFDILTAPPRMLKSS